MKGMIMTIEEIGGVVRTVVAAGLAYLAGKGIIAQGDVAALAAAVTTIGVAVWSVISKRKAA